jgi:hypothetical protein
MSTALIEGHKSWRTLDEVGAVVAASVDDKEDPHFANIHLLPATRCATASIEPMKRASRPATRFLSDAVSGFPGMRTKAPVLSITSAPAPETSTLRLRAATLISADNEVDEEESKSDEGLTIPEAKRRLGIKFGVDPSCIKIIVEG